MPPKKKQCIAPENQENLLEDFYYHLEDDTFLSNDKYCYCAITELSEIKAFVALLYIHASYYFTLYS